MAKQTAIIIDQDIDFNGHAASIFYIKFRICFVPLHH